MLLPDGRELEVGDAGLDAFLSERYADELRVLQEDGVPHHDAAPLHLLTTSSVRWLRSILSASRIDARRFRPNVLLESPGAELAEDAWVGRRFALGGAVIRVDERTERCVMTTNAQSELEGPGGPAGRHRAQRRVPGRQRERRTGRNRPGRRPVPSAKLIATPT